MAKTGKTKSRLTEINRGLELLAELVRMAPPLIDRLRPPLVTPSQQTPETGLTPYEVFGLPPNAGRNDFKKRYRDLMRLFHSDKGSGSDAMAKRVNQAWDEIRQEKGWS